MPQFRAFDFRTLVLSHAVLQADTMQVAVPTDGDQNYRLWAAAGITLSGIGHR